jgi:hypothetical protein
LTNTATGEDVRAPLRRAEEGWQNEEFILGAGTWRVRVSAVGATPVTDLCVVAGA